jgi:hypothetical protein
MTACLRPIYTLEMKAIRFFETLVTICQLHGIIPNLYGMHPVVCHLRKDITCDCRKTNNQKETKWTLLCQHLFLFVVGGNATYFDPFIESPLGVHEY